MFSLIIAIGLHILGFATHFSAIPKTICTCLGCYNIIPTSLVSLHACRYEAPVEENMHKLSSSLAGWSLRGDIRWSIILCTHDDHGWTCLHFHVGCALVYISCAFADWLWVFDSLPKQWLLCICCVATYGCMLHFAKFFDFNSERSEPSWAVAAATHTKWYTCKQVGKCETCQCMIIVNDEMVTAKFCSFLMVLQRMDACCIFAKFFDFNPERSVLPWAVEAATDTKRVHMQT